MMARMMAVVMAAVVMMMPLLGRFDEPCIGHSPMHGGEWTRV
jgi:hypothetical protein